MFKYQNHSSWLGWPRFKLKFQVPPIIGVCGALLTEVENCPRRARIEFYNSTPPWPIGHCPLAGYWIERILCLIPDNQGSTWQATCNTWKCWRFLANYENANGKAQGSLFSFLVLFMISWLTGQWLESVIAWVDFFMSLSACLDSIHYITESMAGHRAHKLLLMLPNALEFGYSEIEPHPEPLKVGSISCASLISLDAKLFNRTSTRIWQLTLMIQILASSFLDQNLLLVKRPMSAKMLLVNWMHIWRHYASHGQAMIHVWSALKLTGCKTYHHIWHI